MRALRWIGRIAAGLVGFVVLAVIGIVIFMQTAFGQEFVRKQVEGKLAATFQGGATIGHVSGNPFTDIVLRDVVIAAPNGEPAVKVGELHLHAGLLPLISKKIVLTKVIANDVDVDATQDLAHVMKPSEKEDQKKGGSSAWSVRLPELELHRGHVKLERDGEPIDLDGIEIGATIDLPAGGPANIGAAISATWRQKRTPIGVAASLHAGERIQVPIAIVSAGDVTLWAANVDAPKDGNGAITGDLAIHAPAREVAELVPNVKLPADVTLAISARPDEQFTRIALSGTIGRGELGGALRADTGARYVRGFVGGARLPLGELTHGKLEGRGNTFVAFDVAPAGKGEQLPRAHALVQAWGELGSTVIAVDSDGTHAHTTVGATGSAGLGVGVGASLAKTAQATTLEDAVIVADYCGDDRGQGLERVRSTSHPSPRKCPEGAPERSSGGRAPVHGALHARLEAHGTLAPEADLAVAGHVDGDRLRVKDLSARALHLQIDAAHAPAHPIGTARLEVSDVVRGDLQLRTLTLAAGNRPDGKIQVSLRTEPKPAPWLFDLDALVTPGKTVAIDLQRHFVRAAGGSTWRGTGGRVAIAPDHIEVDNLHSASRDGNFALAAKYMRAGRTAGDLSAQLDASVELGNLGNKYHGHVDAKVDVARAAKKWRGTVDAKATGVTIDPRAPRFDADAKIDARGGKLVANVGASVVGTGAAKVALDVDAPADLANARAWRMLTQRAIRESKITLDGLDVAALAKLAGKQDKQLSGRIDGTLEITQGKIAGDIRATSIRGQPLAGVGTVDAEIKVDEPKHDEIATTATAKLGNVGKIDLAANLGMPDRIFDPNAWKRLGTGALRGATLRADEISFEPGTLEQLGIVSNFRGKVALRADIEPGLHGARAQVNLRELRGGIIAMPVEAKLDATADGSGTRATLSFQMQGKPLVELRAQVPVSLARWRQDPKGARGAQLVGKLTIPHVPVRQLLATLGNTQVQGGTLDGVVELGGTIGRPTAKAAITAHDVSVPPAGADGGKPLQAIKELKIDGRWDGAAGQLAIVGTESAGGTLKITAGGRADAPQEIGGTLEAHQLDIGPLVAFMPGPAGGIGGRLDAKLDVRGIDPRTSQIGGQLHLTESRLPIAPAIGTLFHGDVSVKIADHMLRVDGKGKLGNGDIAIAGAAPLDGAAPTGGQIKLNIRKVQMIGTTEPIISAQIAAQMQRMADHWQANVQVDKAFIEVPKQKGNKLAPVGAPPDLVYGGPARRSPPTQVQGGVAQPHRRPPEHPAFVANITLHATSVESEEVRGTVSGNLKVLAGGKELGLVGQIKLDRGDLNLFDRRYDVEKAILSFDGSSDPELDVRITHDFPDVTTITEVHGRASKPQLRMSSEPATYSQSELLGFLLGGEPGGDPNMAPSARARVEGAGASFLANKVGGYIKNALPVDIDVLRYESASATSSAAVEVGTWITHDLFLAWRQHLEARPDENAGEGEIEYWIQRRLSLTGTVGDRGYDGLDLLWRRRW